MKSTILAAAALVACSAGVVSAAPISLTSGDVNSSFTIAYNGTDDNVASGPFNPNLTAEAVFTLTAFNTNSLVLQVDLTNTTQAPVTSRVSVFAFDVDPNISGASVTGDFYNRANLTTPMNAHGVGSLDVCFKTGNATCNNGTGGPTAGQSGTFYVTLNFLSTITTVDLSNFIVRYQSLNFGSGSGVGTGTCIDCEPPPCEGNDCTPPDDVPEPASIALLGLGLLGAGVARRRRRQ